jgi:hypothetical protein
VETESRKNVAEGSKWVVEASEVHNIHVWTLIWKTCKTQWKNRAEKDKEVNFRKTLTSQE